MPSPPAMSNRERREVFFDLLVLPLVLVLGFRALLKKK